MRNRLIFFSSILIVLILAIVAMLDVEQNEQTQITQSLLSDNTSELDVSEVRISYPEGLIFIAQRYGDIWVSQGSGDAKHPLKQAAIERLLNQLTHAAFIEKKSSKVMNQAKLGLADLDAEEGAAIKVDIVLPDGTIEIFLGDTDSNQRGQFVRFANENQMWLIDRSITIPDGRFDWFERKFDIFNSNDVVRIVVINDSIDMSLRRILDWSDSEKKDLWINQAADAENADDDAYREFAEALLGQLEKLDFDNVYANTDFEGKGVEEYLLVEVVDTQQRQISYLFSQTEQGFVVNISSESETIWQSDWTYQVPDYQVQGLGRLIENVAEQAEAP